MYVFVRYDSFGEFIQQVCASLASLEFGKIDVDFDFDFGRAVSTACDHFHLAGNRASDLNFLARPTS